MSDLEFQSNKQLEQIKNNIYRIKIYQDIDDLIKRYNPKYIIELFKILGEYIEVSKNLCEKYKEEKYKNDYDCINKSSRFFNIMRNFSERDLNEIKLYGISYILGGLEYNEIFKELFYKWYKLININ